MILENRDRSGQDHEQGRLRSLPLTVRPHSAARLASPQARRTLRHGPIVSSRTRRGEKEENASSALDSTSFPDQPDSGPACEARLSTHLVSLQLPNDKAVTANVSYLVSMRLPQRQLPGLANGMESWKIYQTRSGLARLWSFHRYAPKAAVGCQPVLIRAVDGRAGVASQTADDSVNNKQASSKQQATSRIKHRTKHLTTACQYSNASAGEGAVGRGLWERIGTEHRCMNTQCGCSAGGAGAVVHRLAGTSPGAVRRVEIGLPPHDARAGRQAR
ncbi:hypothetical protein K402DRAFT_442147 [Aulographum hederae CBS 113979]|uniref:Uncharacterized protein n=1 Tax=Aulographum hederae CBS 113979 TaxID=1176131 RepID=A0A6G1H9R1_9PEZI|nr:hypothetical protein K402DRAFT_442147 [Aulographum hederae CBS 113979]